MSSFCSTHLFKQNPVGGVFFVNFLGFLPVWSMRSQETEVLEQEYCSNLEAVVCADTFLCGW